ncbi:Amicyanin precursor [compost metagenome]
MMKRECLIVACTAILAGCGVATDTAVTGGSSPRYGVLNWCDSCGADMPSMPEEAPPENTETETPTDQPTETPTEMPTDAPTAVPSVEPTPHEKPPVSAPATPAPTPCAAASTAPAEAVTIVVKDFEFVPATVTVAPGTTVTWKFEGPAPHTSTSSMGASVQWDSGTKRPGESFSYTFDTAGTHHYHCTLHPRMQGSVTVGTAGGD